MRMLPLGRPVYLSDVSQIERRVSPHDFRKPGVDSTREAPRVAQGKKKAGENSYFFPSNLFGLLSLASLVCSIIMAPAGSAPTPADRPTARRNSKRLLARRREADFVSSFPPFAPSVKFIYLVNRAGYVEFYFFPQEKKKETREKKEKLD